MDPTRQQTLRKQDTGTVGQARGRQAQEAPLPVPDEVPHWSETMTHETGLWLVLWWDGQEERTELLEAVDLADGRRALLTIVRVRRPGIRMAWVIWEPERMRLVNRWERGAPAAAEADSCEGDAHRIAVGEMSDCFWGDFTTFSPHRAVDVRVGGRWYPGKLSALFHGEQGRAVASATVSFFEPEWGAVIAYKRLYRMDPKTIRRSPDAR